MIRRFAAVFLALAAAAGCGDPSFKPPIAFQAEFTPAAGETLSGSVAAVSQGRATEAGITVRLGQAGKVVGWEIRVGTCANPGERFGGRGAYPDMTGDATGVANVERTFVNETMDENTRYHAVVVDAADRTDILACANLIRVQF